MPGPQAQRPAPKIGVWQGQLAHQTGPAHKQTERQLEQAGQLLDELTEFARTIEAAGASGLRAGR